MMGAEGSSPVKIVTPSSWTRHSAHNGGGTTSRSCDGIPSIPRRVLANNGLGNGSLPPDIDLADDSDSVSRSSRLGEIIALSLRVYFIPHQLVPVQTTNYYHCVNVALRRASYFSRFQSNPTQTKRSSTCIQMLTWIDSSCCSHDLIYRIRLETKSVRTS